MDSAKVNGVEIEYAASGSGEPVLLIPPVVADGFEPLVSEPALGDYELICYHKRGWLGSTHAPGPVSIEDHAADAAALLGHLGIPRAHVVGHSSGACVTAQLALDEPETVATVGLLEPSPLSHPSGQVFAQRAGPVFDLYESGDHEAALAAFMSTVSGLEWADCRVLLDERVPGAIENGLKDIHTLFAVELPALVQWHFGAEKASTITQPVLSIVGSQTASTWVDIAEFLRATITQVEECTIEGAGHLLQIQRPAEVAQGIAGFLHRHPM